MPRQLAVAVVVIARLLRAEASSGECRAPVAFASRARGCAPCCIAGRTCRHLTTLQGSPCTDRSRRRPDRTRAYCTTGRRSRRRATRGCSCCRRGTLANRDRRRDPRNRRRRTSSRACCTARRSRRSPRVVCTYRSNHRTPMSSRDSLEGRFSLEGRMAEWRALRTTRRARAAGTAPVLLAYSRKFVSDSVSLRV